jgi:hypothetical protein
MLRILTWFSHFLKQQNAVTNPLDALPDFQNFRYTIAIEPIDSRIDAWVKLREAERRLTMFKWVEQHNDHANPQHRVLLDDSASAFLLTFEAAIQFLKDQLNRSVNRSETFPQFDTWFAGQPQNDIHVKGLRTLRLFEAHVEAKPIPRTIHVHINASFGGRKSGAEIAGCTWQLPKLTPAHLQKLYSPRLSGADLSDWNTLVVNLDAKTIFAEGLQRLKCVLETAEKMI